MTISNDTPSDVDQEDHYGIHDDVVKQMKEERAEEHEIYTDAARRTFNLPPRKKPMNLTQNTTGMGWKEFVVVMTSFLVAFLTVVACWFMLQPNPPPDREYEVRFFDADGNPIEVPQKQ
jgi:hypothetical protein